MKVRDTSQLPLQAVNKNIYSAALDCLHSGSEVTAELGPLEVTEFNLMPLAFDPGLRFSQLYRGAVYDTSQTLTRPAVYTSLISVPVVNGSSDFSTDRTTSAL